MRASKRIESGKLSINTASFTGPLIPFRGWNQSGLAHEGGAARINEIPGTKIRLARKPGGLGERHD
ncbi:aldehyde dehydrogenase family protein [Bradyrhizobium sp. F1.4.3]|uniref:aldehyde dehydrogenase family protein n=1 Tax=Bradyrhizobium sp. F1.4.3 TaxID=3156356 RepID=UPI00339B82CF